MAGDRAGVGFAPVVIKAPCRFLFPLGELNGPLLCTPANNPKHEQDTTVMAILKCAPSSVIGIDVSKDTLAVFDQARQSLVTICNSRAAIRKLIASFPAGALAICEPTGGHEALLVNELNAEGIACHRADTLKVKAFIRSFGRLAKTDTIDAKALAQYGGDRWNQLPLYKPTDKTQARLTALVSRRQDLLAFKTAETNRAKAPGHAIISRSCKTVMACLQRQLEQIDQQIENLIASSQVLSQRHKVHLSLPGVGPRTSIALLATMPELGTLTRRQAASLAGLAPHPKDSGTLKGYRRMHGGRPEVRKSLFMAALAASRTQGRLKTFYQRLIENGKKAIVAISALMRKIIVILNARIRDEFAQQS